ncbi:MAG: hypothetical protein ACC656_08120, partial [Candidatus Heimdallarchaeota archaeon]
MILELFKNWIRQNHPECTIDTYLERSQFLVGCNQTKLRCDIVRENHPTIALDYRFLVYQMAI